MLALGGCCGVELDFSSDGWSSTGLTFGGRPRLLQSTELEFMENVMQVKQQLQFLWSG